MAIYIKKIDERINQISKKRKLIKELLIKYDINVEEQEKNKTKSIQQFFLSCNHLKNVKVACVMDRFTLDSFSPECNLLEVTPDGWKEEIDEFKPDLLFIESAWNGKNNLWYKKIANGSKEFFEMASYCQEKNVPIIFWNKEDPVYTDIFMVVARMADIVFTTDIDCVKKYKDTLKHDNVYHLHFAAQPKLHNPIEKYERKDKYCFAGAYYHRYKKRAEVFDKFSEIFINDKGFDIYDRNYKSALPEHAFPTSYDKYILGKLDPSEIDIAYKGYNYGINMNSISQSQTMFARRVFEMLASNTVTIGNYSRGVKNYFGDLTICTDDEETLKKNIKMFCNDETTYRKYRLLGLRKVLQQHLYEDRLNYIIKKIFNVSLIKQLPQIIAVGLANDLNEANSILESFDKQKYNNKILYIIAKDEFIKDMIKDVNVINEEDAKSMIIDKFDNGSYISTLSPNDYYGENYFMDLILTTRYGNYSGIGKADYYFNDANNKIIIENISNTYKSVEQLSSRCSIIKISKVLEHSLYDLSISREIKMDNLFSIDEFNYCKNYVNLSCPIVDDLKLKDYGLGLNEIQCSAEKITYDKLNNKGVSFKADEITKLCKITEANIQFSKENGKLIIESTLGEDTHHYIYIDKLFELNDYEDHGKLSFIFNGVGDLDLTGVCIFYDSNKKKIMPTFTQMNKLVTENTSSNAKYFKLGFRLKGKGKFILDNISISLDKNPNEKGCFLSRSNVLVLTNHYPSHNDLYRNMFVHKRLTAYKENGHVYDVMRMNIYARDKFREFEGINVVEGQSEVLADIIEKGIIDTVCIHFLDNQMWNVLRNYLDRLRIVIWAHGADIQPWWRRTFNFTVNELDKEKKNSEERMKLWMDVFSLAKVNKIHFVFVSKYFANEIMEDYKIEIPIEKYSIIHNLIDTELFKYIPKNENHRLRILTIKPFASKKYANDLTTKAILELSKFSIFKDLEFDIYGDGEYFEIDNAPLKKFKNIYLHKTFLKQEEIYELHKSHGVFIATTRWDSHGVSRDEAMSSGLVPITNNVSAIPEFVDDTCGILVPEEDYLGVVQGIIKLYNEPEYFLELSKNAAKRVRGQTTMEFTIKKELKLVNSNF